MKFFSTIMIIIIFLSPLSIKAAPVTNFGGQIVGARPCENGRNFIVYVRDVRGYILPLTFQPGLSMLYAMYQPRPAVNALGSFVPGDACSGFSAIGTILQIATSLGI